MYLFCSNVRTHVHRFPEHVAFPCCGVGFMLTLLLERVLLASSEHAHAHGKKDVKESDDEAQILTSPL